MLLTSKNYVWLSSREEHLPEFIRTKYPRMCRVQIGLGRLFQWPQFASPGDTEQPNGVCYRDKTLDPVIKPYFHAYAHQNRILTQNQSHQVV